MLFLFCITLLIIASLNEKQQKIMIKNDVNNNIFFLLIKLFNYLYI